MPWKTDENGNLVVENGQPVYTFDSGDEAAIDFDKERGKIQDLNHKVQNRGRRIQNFENTIKMLNDAGIDTSDPDGVNKFIDAIKKAQPKGDPNKTKTLEERIKHLEEYNNKLNDSLKEQKKNRAFDAVKQAFSNSDFVKQRTAFPDPEIAYDYLKPYFKLDESNGNVTAYGTNSKGERLWVDENPANLEQAIEIIIKNHPKASRLLAIDGGGSGAGGSRPPARPTPKKTISKSDNQAFIDNLEDIAKGNVTVE